MSSCSLTKTERNPEDSQAINNLCEYLRIPSVHPNVNYDDCVKFLEKQAKSIDLPFKIIHIAPQKPIVIITWIGSDPTLPSILLNSHMDVVPVFEDKWTHKPFSAHIDNKNNIYARGTQDMKSVGIQHIEAVKKLKQKGVTLKRTVHISFVPDEEIGGTHGMKQFVHTKEFQDLNVGLALDESVANPGEELVLFYGERCLWHIHIHCPGNPGHGSLLLENTAGEKVAYILKKFYEFRNQEIQKLKQNSNLHQADVTSINLTKIKGGVQTNVIPPEFILTFDCRIEPTVDFKKWVDTLNQWCKDAGKGVWIEFEHKDEPVTPTKLENNIYWTSFKEATDKLGLKVKTMMCPGVTDARFVRALGISAFGFSPMNYTPILLHNNDEHIGIDTFLNGIKIFAEILISVGNKTGK